MKEKFYRAVAWFLLGGLAGGLLVDMADTGVWNLLYSRRHPPHTSFVTTDPVGAE
jgi:hypothetical protein